MHKLDPNAIVQLDGAEGLRRYIADSARPFQNEQPDGDEPSALPIVPWKAKDETEVPPRKWVFGRHYIKGYASLAVAPGASGKSALVIAEALSMATGRRLLHHTPRKPLKVLVWNLEDPLEEIERRVVAIAKRFGIDPLEYEGRLFLASGRDLEFKIARSDRGGFQLNEGLIAQVVLTIRENGIDVLIIDPLVSAHYVSENDNTAMDAVMKALSSIAGKANCAIEVVHHVRKGLVGQTTEPSADDARGASAVVGAVRSARLIQKMTEDEASQAAVQGRRGHYFRTVDAKANFAPPSENSTWYQIEGVQLDNGDEDFDADAVGVVTPWTFPTLTETLPQNIIQQVQAKVRGGKYRDHEQSDEWVGYALGPICGLDPYDKGQRKKLKALIRQWLNNGILVKVSRQDASRRWHGFIEVPEGDAYEQGDSYRRARDGEGAL